MALISFDVDETIKISFLQNWKDQGIILKATELSIKLNTTYLVTSMNIT